MKTTQNPSKRSLVLATATLILTHSIAHGQSNWLGGDDDYNAETNWDTNSVPAPLDDVVISSGTATLASGNFERAGNTTLAGGNLVIANGRLLNNRPNDPGTANFVVEDGSSLTQTGNYFIVSQQTGGRGVFTQNGGVVTSNIDRGWGTSDGSSTSGDYILNNGTLNINHASDGTDWHVHVGRAPSGSGDLFQINDGGVANLVASTPGGRFYLSNRGLVELNTGGEFNAEGLQYFVVGRGAGGGMTPRLDINGGNLSVGDFDTDNISAFIVSNNGIIQLSEGTINVADSDIWLGDNGTLGRSGTVIQRGGTFTHSGGDLVLGRATTRSGQYFMFDGSLEVESITRGAGVDSYFFYQGGTVLLPGDQTEVINEPWLVSFGDVNANYDAVEDLTTLTVTPAVGDEKEFRYYRFTTQRLRSGINIGTVHLADFEFLNQNNPVDLSSVTVSNPGGDDLGIHPVENLIDGDPSTKWLDVNNQPVVFDFGVATTIDGYRFTTANDIPDRDPIRWLIEGSNDGDTWEAISEINRQDITPTGRLVSSIDIPITEISTGPTQLTWTGSIDNNWDTSTFNWDDGFATNWVNETPGAEATFGAAGAGSINLSEAITASRLTITASGYDFQGSNSLELTGDGVLNFAEDVEISVPINAADTLVKTGAGQLTLTDSTTAATLQLNDGSILVGDGGALAATNTDMSAAENSRTMLEINAGGTATLSNSPRLGLGNNAAAVIALKDGNLTTGGPGVSYLELGGNLSATTDSYGALVIEGGTYDSGTSSDSGIRVGGFGLGLFEQTGGTADVGRWFAIGRPGGEQGRGLVNLLGGNLNMANNFRILIGDSGDSVGTLNLGSQAGGSATLTTLNPAGLSVGQNANTTATLNLNSGTLVLGGPIFKNNGSAQGIVNIDGATLVAGTDEIALMANNLTTTNLYNGGLTVDTNGNNATLNANFTNPSGQGVYIDGGSLPVSAGGEGYLAPPLVSVSSDGFGSGLTAIAQLSNNAISAVLVTSPGSGYELGDTLTFTFEGGGPTAPAPDFTYTLTATDIASNTGAGGLTKIGSGTLSFSANSDYSGNTEVVEGTLEVNGFMGSSTVNVATGATFTGNFNTLGPVNVNGTLGFGASNLIGGAQAFGALTLEPGAALRIRLGDWTLDDGIGYDTSSFDQVNLNTTPGEPLTIELDSSLIENFTESGKTLTLVSSFFGINGLSADNWQVSAPGFPGTGTWELIEADSALTLIYTEGVVASSDYDDWVASFPDLTDSAPFADPDGDQIPNILEYVLIGDPTTPGGSILPTIENDGTTVSISLVRRAGSTSVTTQTLEYSTDLNQWETLALPETSNTIVTVTPDTPENGQETLTISLPATSAPDGRLFGRLRVEEIVD